MSGSIDTLRTSTFFSDTTLRDAVFNSLDQFVSTIDFNIETISKIKMKIKSKPFHLTEERKEEQRYSCYAEFSNKYSTRWNPESPLFVSVYPSFQQHQKKQVADAIKEDLAKAWDVIIKTIAEKDMDKGPLAFVEGEISVKLKTVQIQSNVPSLHQTKRSFKIIKQ